MRDQHQLCNCEEYIMIMSNIAMISSNRRLSTKPDRFFCSEKNGLATRD